MKTWWWRLLMLGLWQCSVVSAAPDGLAFSAVATLQVPGEEVHSLRIHVAGSKVRTEYRQGDESRIEIVDTAAQTLLVLLPAEQAYFEYPLPDRTTVAPLNGAVGFNPCASVPDASCRRLREETIGQRRAVLWEMVEGGSQPPLRSLHWLDAELNLPLRQLLHDGSVVEMHKIGRAQIDGRAVSHWRQTRSSASGRELVSEQWIDRELRIVIREARPGGYLRELRDIRVGPPPSALFAVPAGYQRLEPVSYAARRAIGRPGSRPAATLSPGLCHDPRPPLALVSAPLWSPSV